MPFKFDVGAEVALTSGATIVAFLLLVVLLG